MVWLQEAKQIWTSRRAMPAMLVISSPRAVRGSVHTAERMHSWAPSERHLSAIWAPGALLPVPLLCHSCATVLPLVGSCGPRRGAKSEGSQSKCVRTCQHCDISAWGQAKRERFQALALHFLHSFFKILTGPSVFTCFIASMCLWHLLMLRIPSQSGRRGCRTRRAVVFCWIACGHSCPIGEHWQLSQVTHSRRLRGESWAPLGTANAKGCSLRSCTLNSCLKQLLLRVQNWCRNLPQVWREQFYTRCCSPRPSKRESGTWLTSSTDALRWDSGFSTDEDAETCATAEVSTES